MRYLTHCYCLLIACLLSTAALANDPTSTRIPILVYHNFNPTVPGSMTITPEKFEAQLQWLKAHGYTVVPLKEVVSYLQGERASLPAKSVVITADDGWESVYQYMVPIAKKYNIPVTLFIYPTAISNARHAMTWDQLRALQQTGLFDIQGHTYWHPNFKQEKRHLSLAAYQQLVHTQLFDSKEVLEKKLNIKITLLAWPYGIYDPYLEAEAAKAGYTMAFSIDYRKANRAEKAMSQPRYMMIESQNMRTFASIIS